jgi:hypothetical protein
MILVSISKQEFATKPIFTIDSTTAFASFMMESMEEAITSNCSSSSSSSSSDDDVVATVVRTTAAVAASIATTTKIISGTSHSGKVNAYSDGTKVRKKRRVFDHAGALHCITRDYLGLDPLFGKEFPLMFRLSRPRFEILMQAIKAKEIKFYMTETDGHGNTACSSQARLLLPLKT